MLAEVPLLQLLMKNSLWQRKGVLFILYYTPPFLQNLLTNSVGSGRNNLPPIKIFLCEPLQSNPLSIDSSLLLFISKGQRGGRGGTTPLFHHSRSFIREGAFYRPAYKGLAAGKADLNCAKVIKRTDDAREDLFNILRSLPSQHWAGVGCTENGQPIKVTVHSDLI